MQRRVEFYFASVKCVKFIEILAERRYNSGYIFFGGDLEASTLEASGF